MADLHDVADRLFAAFTGHDYDTVRALLAPDAVAWSNVRNRESTVDQLLAGLPALRAAIGDHRYEDVRRIVGDDGFVEQHTVRSVRSDGRELDLGEACVVVRVGPHGLITRLDEYVDTAGVQAALRG